MIVSAMYIVYCCGFDASSQLYNISWMEIEMLFSSFFNNVYQDTCNPSFNPFNYKIGDGEIYFYLGSYT